MNLLVRRKTRRRKAGPQWRSTAHLAWIRGFECVVCVKTGQARASGMEAAHVRTGTDGGMGVKSSDWWAIPLCAVHHSAQHRMGETAFEAIYGIDMKKIAQDLYSRSPHRMKVES